MSMRAPMLLFPAAALALLWYVLAPAASTWTGSTEAPQALLPSANETTFDVFGTFEFVRGMLAMTVRSLALAAVALFVAARFAPRFGSLTLVFGLASLVFAAQPAPGVGFATEAISALVAGIAGDVLNLSLRPFSGSPWRVQLFGFAVPLVFWSVHLGLVAATSHGLWWPMYAYAGASVYAALAGLLLATLVGLLNRRAAPSVQATAGPDRLDWAFSLAALCFGAGVALDGWAHNHLQIVDALFARFHRTPSITPLDHEILHSVLYLGFLAMAAIAFAATLANGRRGIPWRAAVPSGYGPALAGVAIFLLGGIADVLWHLAFGVESSLWALISPPHLLLISGASLAVLAPVRSALGRNGDRSFLERVPALLSLAGFLAGVAFFTMIAYTPWASRAEAPSLVLPGVNPAALDLFGSFEFARGLLSVILRSALLAGIGLFVAGRFQPRFGTLTVTLGALGFAAAAMIYLPPLDRALLETAPALAVGLAADVYIATMSPFAGAAWRYYLFSAALPAAYWVLALAVSAATGGGLWWPLATTASVVICAALTGFALATAVRLTNP